MTRRDCEAIAAILATMRNDPRACRYTLDAIARLIAARIRHKARSLEGQAARIEHGT